MKKIQAICFSKIYKKLKNHKKNCNFKKKKEEIFSYYVRSIKKNYILWKFPHNHVNEAMINPTRNDFSVWQICKNQWWADVAWILVEMGLKPKFSETRSKQVQRRIQLLSSQDCTWTFYSVLALSKA
jgi:hypothetical protein